MVAPLEEKTATQSTVTDNYDNVVARTEDVTLINGSGLKAYSVVVGSFSVKANAEGLQSTLKSAGYDAQLAYNSNRNMYRVVASTYDTKGDAARSRDAFRATYPDAWLLFKKEVEYYRWHVYFPLITGKSVPDWQSPIRCRLLQADWRLFLRLNFLRFCKTMFGGKQ